MIQNYYFLVSYLNLDWTTVLLWFKLRYRTIKEFKTTLFFQDKISLIGLPQKQTKENKGNQKYFWNEDRCLSYSLVALN